MRITYEKRASKTLFPDLELWQDTVYSGRRKRGGIYMSDSSEDMSIWVLSLGRLPRGDKDPLIKEIRRIDPDLEYDEAYGGGGPLPPDCVLTFIQIVITGYATAFFTAAGAAHYKTLHKRIARLIKKLTREEEKALKGVGEDELSEVEGELPRTAPLSISIGRVHFHFQGKPTPEQVAERLRKVRAIVDALPEHDLRVEMQEEYEVGGPRNFVWDDDARGWIEKGPRPSDSGW